MERCRLDGYGEGPTEIFRNPERAAHRIAQLLDPAPVVAPTRLRAIRELYGVTQKQIAAKLKIQQAAISRWKTGAIPRSKRSVIS